MSQIKVIHRKSDGRELHPNLKNSPQTRPIYNGYGYKTYEKRGMGRAWVLRLKMGMGIGMDS